MICRLWHGWTLPRDAAAYERLLRTEILPGIERRGIPGYRGAQLLRREAGGEVEFVTLLWWESLDAVRGFAGEEFEVAVIPPAARALLARYDERVAHYPVLEPGPLAPAGPAS